MTRRDTASDRSSGLASVRQLLAARTRAAHRSLHTHPWISLLAEPSLTVERYRVVLEAYLIFSTHVESSRASLDVLPSLSLAHAILALESDVAALHGTADRLVPPPGITLADRPSLLGALYVLHGSGFGNKVLSRSVRDSLPDAPRRYLDDSVPPGSWRRLEAELEELRDDVPARERLVRSAGITFEAFGRFVTRYCETPAVATRDGTRAAPTVSRTPP